MQKYQIILLISCGLLIASPLATDMLLNFDKYFPSRSEESGGIRKMAIFDFGEVTDFRGRMKNRYQNEFILSDVGFSIYRDLNHSILDREPLPQKVIRGKDGWLFLANGMSNVIYESTGVSNFTEGEMVRLKEIQMKRAAELEREGISYYLTIAPNKHTVYRDKLDFIQDDKPTRYEQIVESFKNEEFNFIDLSGLVDQRKKMEVYYKNDTHWNDYGAFFAYEEIISTMQLTFPELSALVSSDLLTVWNKDKEMDLYRILKKNPHVNNSRLVLKEKHGLKVDPQLPVPQNSPYTHEIRYVNPDKERKLLVFRDSFTSAMVPFFAESFGEAVFIWSSYDEKIVEKEKPDIVLVEVVERFMEKQLR